MQEGTVSSAEVARFDALAGQWWDPRGPMRALHRMNPARVEWIAGRAARAFPGAGGLRVLDVGCGAGLAAEALARRGHDVLGIDAAPDAVAAAAAHAAGQGLSLAYRVASPERLAEEGMRFPVVLALEVVEHVPDPDLFLRSLATLLEPEGLLVLSTINRTTQSFLAAKVAAEYVLRWLPPGTHDWRRFLTPAELAAGLRRAGLRVTELCGLRLDPLSGRWRTGGSLAVNYLMAARK